MPTRTQRTPRAVRAKLAQTQPMLRLRMRVTAGEHIAVGPGKIALLEAIASTGSLTAAAQSLEMSYRRAWLLLNDLNNALREPAVVSAKGGVSGGGSELTDVGRQLIELYRGIEKRAEAACADDIRRLLALLGR